MKNVVIVTWLGTGNFGTSLQSFALHEYLKNKGYNVSILHRFQESDWCLQHRIREFLKTVKESIKKLLNRKYARLHHFNKEKYNHTIVSSLRQYERLLAETNVFVTGSDQIWNCYHNYDPFMFLQFAGQVKRIAYASSMGTADFPAECQKQVFGFLTQFEHIGVREQSMVDYLNVFLHRNDVTQVLDPTFLLTAQEWKRFGEKAQPSVFAKEPYIFCYLIGNREEYTEQLRQVLRLSQISHVVVIPSLESGGFSMPGATVCTDAGPYEFIHLLDHASLIVTDSFHACALSINLSKDFVAFKRFSDKDKGSQNSRLCDLLSHYSLENRWFDTSSNYPPVDYRPIQKILETDQLRSSSYLINSIES